MENDVFEMQFGMEPFKIIIVIRLKERERDLYYYYLLPSLFSVGVQRNGGSSFGGERGYQTRLDSPEGSTNRAKSESKQFGVHPAQDLFGMLQRNKS